MTVRELLEALRGVDNDAPVLVHRTMTGGAFAGMEIDSLPLQSVEVRGRPYKIGETTVLLVAGEED